MKIFILLIILINYAVVLKAQYYIGYDIIYSEYPTYSDMQGGVISSATGDNGAENINLPFNFNYMGINYSNARISVNGWLELGQTYTGPGYFNDLASTIYKPLICPLWDDLFDDENSFIKYKTEGISPTRTFIVEWNNIFTGSSRKNFQVRLNEVDGSIEFKYGAQSGNGNGLSASIGMNDHIGGINHFISITPSYPLNVDTTIANNNINSFEGLEENVNILIVPWESFSVRIVQITDDVIVGSVNQPILSILITSHLGVLTMPSVTSVSFNTNGTTNTNDIINAKLFSTGRNPNFSAASQSGSTISDPNGNFTINGGGGLWDNCTNYLWLTYDVSSSAQIGNVLDAECTLLTFSLGYSSVVPDVGAPNGSRVIGPGNGLAGIYTIGDSGDFNSLSAIMDSISETYINGPITIELLADYNSVEESFPIVFPYISGNSIQNQIMIQPALNAGNVIISSNDTATIILDAANFITINGQPGGIIEEQALSIVNENPNGSAVIVTGNSKNINFEYIKMLGCNISNVKGVVQSIYNGYYAFSRDISINNCIISKSNNGRPAIGIFFGSGDYPVAFNWIISNCTITDFTDAGVKINQADQTYIQDSEIFLTESSEKDKLVGIIINPNAYLTRVLRNSIHSLSTTTNIANFVTGIEIPFTEYLSVYNNFISLDGNEFSTVTGIDFNGEYYTNNNFYNNSIYIYGSCANSANSYCFRRRAAEHYFGLMLKLLNNLFINERSNVQGTGHHYSIAIEDQRGLQQLDYNNYFVSGNGGVLGRWLNQDISNLADWKVATQKDLFSISRDIFFISEIDLHLTGNSLGDSDLIGLPISVIPNDIDLEVRNPLYPYRGADENLDFPLPVEFISFTASVSDEIVLLNWSTATETNNKGFEILRSAKNDNSWKSIGFVPGFGTTTEPKSYLFTDEDVTSGIYRYRLKQIDFDGTFKFSNEINVEIDVTPKEYVLYQNYPNPFNPTTSIKYDLPNSSDVSLIIYDMLGRKVKELVNTRQQAGRYEIQFNASTFTSGVYVYRLITDKYMNAKKMILMK